WCNAWSTAWATSSEPRGPGIKATAHGGGTGARPLRLGAARPPGRGPRRRGERRRWRTRGGRRTPRRAGGQIGAWVCLLSGWIAVEAAESPADRSGRRGVLRGCIQLLTGPFTVIRGRVYSLPAYCPRLMVTRSNVSVTE